MGELEPLQSPVPRNVIPVESSDRQISQMNGKGARSS